MGVSERKFGVLQTGETVKIFHLENKSGAYAEVTENFAPPMRFPFLPMVEPKKHPFTS